MEDYLSQEQRNVLNNNGFYVHTKQSTYTSWRSEKHPMVRVWLGQLTHKLCVEFESNSRDFTTSYETKEFEFYQNLRKELKVKTDVKR